MQTKSLLWENMYKHFCAILCIYVSQFFQVLYFSDKIMCNLNIVGTIKKKKSMNSGTLFTKLLYTILVHLKKHLLFIEISEKIPSFATKLIKIT